MSETVNFAEWFRERLQLRGMSAGEFAQRAKISRAAAYFYRDGKRVPNAYALVKIASALELEVASLPAFAPRSTK